VLAVEYLSHLLHALKGRVNNYRRGEEMEQGTYQLSGNKFFIGDSVYHLGERKKGLDRKPPLFIRKLKPMYQYISSLYPTDIQNLFTADYKGKAFKVKLEQEQIIIQ